ncbi:MAG: mechanosensitive ion channel family protein [Bacteroidales bacterium]|nr:mechanosensitive ion channel family protein [Bacteroidales bacterium]
MNWKGLLTLILLILTYSLTFSQDSTTTNTNIVDSIAGNIAYVIFEDDTLFTLSENLGPFSPQERANAITERLDDLAENIIIVEDSFNIFETDESVLISYKDAVIMSITDKDAEKKGYSRKYLAENYKEIIRTSFFDNVQIKSTQSWLVRIGLTLLTLAGLIVIFFLVGRLFKWINKKLIAYDKKLKRKRKSVLRYLMPKGQQNIFILFSNIVKYILILLILFLYLPLMFSFLPWTKGIVREFYGYITEPVKYILNGLLDFMPDLFFIIIIFYAARYVVRVLTYIGEEYENDNITLKGFHKDWAKPTLNIIKIIIYAFALIFMFPHLPGSDSPAFQGVSIFLGVLFSLGSTSAIANLVAGIVITYMRPFMIGDRVKIGETLGDVIEKTALVTKIRTLKNENVTIPNATIINAHLWNYTKNASELGLILHTSVTIGYDVPWDTVNKLLIKAALKTTLTQKDPKPFVLQKSLDDFYVNYEINAYTKHPKKMALLYTELHKNILEEFNGANNEILSPHYNAIRDGNSSAIPMENGPDNRNPVEKLIDKATGKDQVKDK